MPDWLVVLLKKSGQVTSQGEQKATVPSYSSSSTHDARRCLRVGPASRAKLVDKVCLPLPSMRAACVEAQARGYVSDTVSPLFLVSPTNKNDRRVLWLSEHSDDVLVHHPCQVQRI
jgi:hypothetical protein